MNLAIHNTTTEILHAALRRIRSMLADIASEKELKDEQENQEEKEEEEK